jgi:hypothetical protein
VPCNSALCLFKRTAGNEQKINGRKIMQAIEFKIHFNDGVIHLPLSYQYWQNGSARVKFLILAGEVRIQTPLKKSALHNH